MSPDWPRDVLGLDAAPEIPADIRRAYARKLKTINQATDIDGFTALRMAYQFALHLTENPDAPKPYPIPPAPHFAAATPQPIAPDLLELDRLETVLKAYGQGRPLAERIAEILAHPLSESAEHGEHLRQTIASTIQFTSQPGTDERNLPVSLTQTTLLWLDTRYGWLSDYTAFHRDFHGDTELLDLMAIRAFPEMIAPRTVVAAQQPDGVFARFWGMIGDWRMIIFLLFIFTQVARYISFLGGGTPMFENPADQKLLTGLVLFALITVGLIFLFRHLRKARTRLSALLICAWFGAGLPILIYAPPTDAGAADRPLVMLWLTGSGLWLIDHVFPSVRTRLTSIIQRYRS